MISDRYDIPTRSSVPYIPPPPPPPPAPAVNDVKEKLASARELLSAIESDTYGMVPELNETVAALPPAERNALVSSWSDSELQTWLDASRLHTNPEDQQALFNTLAQGLDDEQLGRVMIMLDASNVLTADNEVTVRLFGDAIVANKSPTELLQFVQASAGQAEDDGKTALIVAQALDALGAQSRPSTYSGGIPYTPPNYLETALASLSDSQLDSVLQAATQERFEGSACVYEPSILLSLLDRAADGPLSSEQKLRLVDSSMSVVPSFYERPDESGLRDGLHTEVLTSMTRVIDSERGASAQDKAALFELVATKWNGMAGDYGEVDHELGTSLTGLLTSDTNGVVGELESQMRWGAGMTCFVREMISQDRTEELHPILAQLQRGNDLAGDPVARFEAVDGEGNSLHAPELGYFTGSVYAAVSQLNSSREDNAGILGDLVGVGSAFIPNPAGQGAGAAASVLIDEAEKARIEAYQQDNLDLRNTIEELAYPRMPDGLLYDGSVAEGPYDEAVGRVIDHNTNT
jgi:hypothetical protein